MICVVYAIFYVTLDALDMLRGIALTFVIKLLVFHFKSFFLPHSAAELLFTEWKNLYITAKVGKGSSDVTIYHSGPASVYL